MAKRNDTPVELRIRIAHLRAVIHRTPTAAAWATPIIAQLESRLESVLGHDPEDNYEGQAVCFPWYDVLLVGLFAISAIGCISTLVQFYESWTHLLQIK